MDDIGNDILSKVFEVEKGIQEMIDSERKKSEEWICKVRSEIDAEVSNEDEALKKNYKKKEEVEITAARKKAEETLKNAEEQKKKILKIDDKNLMNFIMKHIPKILPGH